jgi:hypothetical protein
MRSIRPMRARSRHEVDGFDLYAEMLRLCRLQALGGADGRLAREPPRLAVRRARRKPRQRLGFAVPSEWRLSVTAYPGVRRGDLEETLLHELVHLAIGTSRGSRRWHGAEFKATLRRAMREAYGLRGVRVANSYHGAYADALERRRRRLASATHPGQLALELAPAQNRVVLLGAPASNRYTS